jgi:hypothetical protein
MEDEVICRFGVPKYVLINNGSKWVIKFDQLCKNYGILHQYIAPQWLRCNGMVERLVKTLKPELIILSVTPKHAHDNDTNLPLILFGYHCGI